MKKRTSISLLFPALLASVPAFVHAYVGGSGYLAEGVGARWLALGGAARAVSRDATAGYWNPAGLSMQGPEEWQVGSMLSLGASGRRTSWLSGSLQTDRSGSWSAGWMRRTEDGLERVDDGGNLAGEESGAQDALFASFGQAPFYRLRWGVTAKALRQGLFDFTGYGGAADVGLLLQPSLSSEVFLALTAENAVSTFSWSTGAVDRLPRAYGAGLSGRFLGGSLLAAFDAVAREGRRGAELHAGAEYWAFDALALRLGLDDSRPAAGAGYRWKPYQFDYAFTYDKEGLGNRHQASLGLFF